MLRESSNERVRVKIRRGGKEKVVRAFRAESKGLQRTRIVYEGLLDLSKHERD